MCISTNRPRELIEFFYDLNVNQLLAERTDMLCIASIQSWVAEIKTELLAQKFK